MSAMRILLLVLALAAVAFVAKYALTSAASAPALQVEGAPAAADRSPPARQLDDVRRKAKDIEGELQKGADRADLPARGE